MVIKASSSKEVEALVADLSAESAVQRDSAIARLTVIGARAVDRLIGLAANPSAPAAARAAAFRALEGIADPRSIPTVLEALTANDEAIVIAAAGTARAFLTSPRGVDVLDRLTAIALDRERPAAVRLSAIHAMSDLERATIKPLFTALRRDPDPQIAAIADPAAAKKIVGPAQRLKDAEDGQLGSDPEALRQAIQAAGGEIGVEVLHQLVERIRVREGAEQAGTRKAWAAVRAAAHLALARRGSRVAIYDLRETLESAREPIAVEFLAAVTALGDSSVLDPIVGAYARTTARRGSDDDWWRRQLVETFQSIAAREKLTRRSAAIKKLEKRWKEQLNELWAPLKL